jgi:hypothetical protein
VDLGNLVHERSFPTMDLWRMGICTIRYDINGVDCYCFGERGGMWHFAFSVALGGFWLARGFVLYDCACTFRGTDPRS